LVNQMMQGRNTDMSPELLGDLDDSSMPTNMEELPAPQPQMKMEEPVDYSLEARKLIDQLNAMRRQAGGEVPEAGKMQSEIQRLMDLGNKTRRATYAAAPQDESSQMFQQAQGMIDQVNDLYRQGHSQGSPQVRQIMQEVRRLQQAGDAIRNRRSA
jgi:regulator of replication initiation timing